MTDLRRCSRVSEDTHVVVKDNVDQQIMTIDHVQYKHHIIAHPQHWHGITIKCYYNCCYPYCHQATTKLQKQKGKFDTCIITSLARGKLEGLAYRKYTYTC